MRQGSASVIMALQLIPMRYPTPPTRWAGLIVCLALAAYFAYSTKQSGAKFAKNIRTTEYVASSACAGCHVEISKTYRQTGMARSFARVRIGNTDTGVYYHDASERHYTVAQREGRFYQRRYQQQQDGEPFNQIEKEMHYVLGSGSHASTYVNRAASGKLVQLPLAWYAGRGGFWAMNPGYDRPDHMDFRREIGEDCLFCHNAYPREGKLGEGIDCQRCHGPGGRHVELAGTKATLQQVRAAIVNPKRLDRDRQLEVCMQCHLESTSRALPYSIVRYGRGTFSYRPGEPLADYILHFDNAFGTGHDDKFEIAHAAYRLRKSACFLKSGTMTCTTCHDPHQKPRADAAPCLSCHSQPHTPSRDCIGCHMPKRRTDDVIHVIMTDHYIQRRKPSRDLLQPLREVHDSESSAYRGEVVPYYPSTADELYVAVAQVKERSNLKAGIRRLREAIARYRPARAEFYYDLAEAYWQTGERDQAIAMYDEALRRDPGYLPALRNFGVALSRSGQFARAIEVLRRAPGDAVALSNLGEVYLQQGDAAGALAVLRNSISLNPDVPEAQNNLGQALSARGDRSAAMAAFREAIRIRPDYAVAHNNLANALSETGDFFQAQRHYKLAIAADAKYAEAHYNYGRALAERKRFREAELEFEQASRLAPDFAEAFNNLGNAIAAQGSAARAIPQFRRAVELKPEFGAARLNLGIALANAGQPNEALKQLQMALGSPDASIRAAASRALEALR